MSREELTGWVYIATLLTTAALILYFPVLDWVMTWEMCK